VRQGRTDAWIAHQLEVTVQQIQAFKREHGLEPDGNGDGNGSASYEEVDLRAEDDAAIAAELEAEEARREEERKAEEAKAAEEAARKAAEAEAEEPEPEEKPKRRTRARSSRSRKKVPTGPLEGTFDHGEEGYGLWLDPAVQDDPVYAEHWAGHRPIEVTIEEDQIVIRRAGSDDEDDDG
jgi:peptidoglycan hydrolase-like protein with peptidoglycan-binding domain